MSSGVADAPAYHIAETGQRVNAVEFELHFQLGLWRVLDRADDEWVVRTRDGETLTLRPI